jgi:pyridoxamine 5'-phosphate oxidase
LCCPWVGLERQVIVAGSVTQGPREETERYFHSRPHGSQLGATASHQSSVIASREELESRFAELAEKYPEGSTVPVPSFWGGYRVVPSEVEFWQGRGNRLHDRVRYTRMSDAGAWRIERLAP